MHLARIRTAELGWTLQADAMTPAASWRQVDVDPLTLLRLTGIEPMRLRLRRMTAMADFDDRDRTAATRYRIRTALSWRMAANPIGPRLTRPTDPTLLDRRNQVALAAMDSTSQDIVQVWGARHLPGLHQAFRDRGYRPQLDSWYTVCRLPSILRALGSLALRRAPTATTDPGIATVGHDRTAAAFSRTRPAPTTAPPASTHTPQETWPTARPQSAHGSPAATVASRSPPTDRTEAGRPTKELKSDGIARTL